MNPSTAVIAASGAVIAAFITALVTLYLSRTKTKIDIQQSLNDGFTGLISSLQKEREGLHKERTELTAQIKHAEQKIDELEDRISKLIKVTISFHNHIIRNNLIPPSVDLEDVPELDGYITNTAPK